MAELTPMMQQYVDTKKQYKDCILFLDWEIFMRCFLRMPSQHPGNWRSR